MKMSNPELSTSFGTEIMQPRTVAQILFNLSALGLINLEIRPELKIVFVDNYKYEDRTVDFVCTLDVEKFEAPFYAEILKNSRDRQFSNTTIKYGEVFDMPCKSVDCMYTSNDSAHCHQYTIRLEVPGLYQHIAEGEMVALAKRAHNNIMEDNSNE